VVLVSGAVALSSGSDDRRAGFWVVVMFLKKLESERTEKEKINKKSEKG
jgi:hypothetical protein